MSRKYDVQCIRLERGVRCGTPPNPSAIDGLNKEKGVGKEWEGRGGVTGRQWTEVSRRAAASVSRLSTKDFFSNESDASNKKI
eukprot:scaffold6876_cov109-Isochrysis_galbana.AAC.6